MAGLDPAVHVVKLVRLEEVIRPHTRQSTIA